MPPAANLPPGASPVATGRPPSRLRTAAYIGIALVGAVGVGWLLGSPPKGSSPPLPPSDKPGEIGSPFEPVRPERAAAIPASLPLPQQPAAPLLRVVNPQPGAGYKPAPISGFQDPPEPPQRVHAQAAAAGGEAIPAAAQGGGDDPLSARLRATDQETAVATLLPDRNLFLTMGQMIPCTPDMPITSDVAGMFSCHLPAPVFGTSGNVPLLDAQTKIVGQIREGLRRGQRRLFATMTRIETPQGCLIRIRAPAADALGQAGLDGEIDNHFWQRFQGYLAVAFLDAAMQAAVLGAVNGFGGGNRGGLNFYQFQGVGRGAGQGAFQEDMSIPPTLYRNQAEPMTVFLAQDIDMRPCFRLRAVR